MSGSFIFLTKIIINSNLFVEFVKNSNKEEIGEGVYTDLASAIKEARKYSSKYKCSIEYSTDENTKGIIKYVAPIIPNEHHSCRECGTRIASQYEYCYQCNRAKYSTHS